MTATTQQPPDDRLTIRHVDRQTWERFTTLAMAEGRQLGAYLSVVLSDWCDFTEAEREEDRREAR